MTLEHNSLLNERYRILEVLGQGGMGSVYRAHDENLGMEVAVKENLFTSDEYSRQFRLEANILANMRHPNLPRVSDHFEIEEQGQYLVMDYIEGEDLRQRMDRLGALQDEEVIIIGAAMCEALKYLHTRTPPILHRDIKPGNIKIDPEGNIYLVDFGLAKLLKGSQVTTTGARAMTPGYSPPEQYGTARTDARSDIYSLGATLYAALANALPEDGLAQAMEQADLTPVRKHNAKVSKRLAMVIEKALEIHPEDRYQTAEEFRVDLLQASTSTKQIQHADEMTVPPPPAEVIKAIAEGKGVKSKGKGVSEPKIAGESKERVRRRRKQRRTKLLRRLLILGIVIITSFFAWYNTGMPYKEQIGKYIPLTFLDTKTPAPTQAYTSSATSELAAVPTFTGTPELPTATKTKIPSTATMTLGATATLTIEVTPTSTILPSITPTFTITPSPGTPTNTIEPGTYPDDIEVIAFAAKEVGTPQLYLYHFSDGSITALPEIDGGACQPAWSPDGLRLAYISPCLKNQLFYEDAFIYVLTLADGNIIKLPLEKGSFDPAWSPDGESILFTRAYSSGQSQIFRLDITDGSIHAMTDDFRMNFDPDWSPDGSQIAFVSNRADVKYVYIMSNVPGAEPALLTRSEDRQNYNPTWSPGGIIVVSQGKIGELESLVYVSIEMLTTDLSFYQEFRVNKDSTIVMEVDPDFNANGGWLAYESWPDGEHHDIYIIRADGDFAFRLTTIEGIEFDPAWKPIP